MHSKLPSIFYTCSCCGSPLHQSLSWPQGFWQQSALSVSPSLSTSPTVPNPTHSTHSSLTFDEASLWPAASSWHNSAAFGSMHSQAVHSGFAPLHEWRQTQQALESQAHVSPHMRTASLGGVHSGSAGLFQQPAAQAWESMVSSLLHGLALQLPAARLHICCKVLYSCNQVPLHADPPPAMQQLAALLTLVKAQCFMTHQ